MRKPIVAFFATVAVALAAAAGQPDPVAAPIGNEISAGWTGVCQHRS